MEGVPARISEILSEEAVGEADASSWRERETPFFVRSFECCVLPVGSGRISCVALAGVRSRKRVANGYCGARERKRQSQR